MAVPTNTVQRVSRVAVREDLSDNISILAQEDTPFMSNIGSGTTGNTYFEWNTDSLVAANANNAQIDGDDLAAEAYAPSTRLGNYVQTMTKTVQLSHITQRVNHAGEHTSKGAAFAKKARELKLDQELRLTGNYAAVPPAAGTAHRTAGAVAFTRTNGSRGVGGAAATLSGTTSGYVSAAATNGTLRTFTEAMLKEAHREAFEAGGKPDMLILSPALKQTFSTFAGIAQQRHEVGNKMATIIGAADIYQGDFGRIAAIPSVYTTGRDALLIDRSLWKVKYLGPKYNKFDQAKSGLSDKFTIETTFGLHCDNELGNAVIADIQA